MPKCAFSGKDIEEGTGIMYVRKDGKILHFLNRKCETNFLKLKRNKRRVRWTNEFHRLKNLAKESKK